MARSSPSQVNFNAGELSPLFTARVDMAKYGNGCYRMRRFLPLPQGPARRCPGTRYVAPLKDQSQRAWAVPFVYSEVDSFILEFGDEYIRFFTDNGQLITSGVAAYNGATAYVVGDLVTSAGTTYYCIAATTGNAPPNATYWYALTGDIYEIPSPYTASDLTDSVNGTFKLGRTQTGDVIFTTHRNHAPRKVTRVGNTNWQVTTADIKNGPFIGINPDETTTVYASAATGSVTLTASTAIFQAQHVDTLFLLEQKATDDVRAWEPAKAVVINDERRSDSNVYRALTAGTTGAVKPIHREGARYDGDTGVQWEYVHSGYGIARITAIGGGGTTATATVISEIPSNAVTAGQASLRWSFSAWDSVLGYPDHVAIFRERLVFVRGNRVWMSVAGDFENFASRDGAETLPDSAITLEIASGQNDETLWVVAGDALLVGTRGAEFSIGEVTTSDPLGPANVRAKRETQHGSRQVEPAVVGDSTLFVLPTGRRVRDLRFSFNVDGYDAIDVTVIADHIAAGRIIQMAYAQEPHSIVWACCEDGSLIGFTFMLEQDVIGWHSHPFSGDDTMIESVGVIPAPDGTYDQIWLFIKRTINGATARYVEYFEKEWLADEDEIEDAVFSDSALSFDGNTGSTNTLTGGTTWEIGDTGAVATVSTYAGAGEIGEWLKLEDANGNTAIVEITAAWALGSFDVQFVSAVPAALQGASGLSASFMRDEFAGFDHLEGEEISVLGDGGVLPNVTVTGGQITTQSRVAKLVGGLPAPCTLETMRIEAGSVDGTAQGKPKRADHVVLRLHESLGGKLGPVGKEKPIQYRSTSDEMNLQVPVFTGDYRTPYNEGYTRDGRIRLINTDPLPMTVAGIFPEIVTYDRS